MDKMQTAKEIRTAIKQGDTQKFIEITDSDKELLYMMTPFGNWLHVAASHGKLQIVKHLVKKGFDINKRGGPFDGGAINCAASNGHIDIVKYLLSCGAEMDVSEPVRNPLFGTITNGRIEIAKLLIENGIDTSVKYTGENMKNMDALAFAIEQGQKEIADLLRMKT
mgnify:CR=1 FL=1